ncbi:MAG: hypothetical protein WBO43_02510, partial [Gemmatimonadota bacterium]
MPYRVARYPVSALCFAALMILACGDNNTEPQTGSIQASLTIDGTMTDADGCFVSVDGMGGQQL